MTPLKAFRMAFFSLLNPRIWVRMMIPIVLAMAIVALFLFWRWADWNDFLTMQIKNVQFINHGIRFIENAFGWSLLATIAAIIIVIFAFLIFYIIGLFLTSLILVPLLIPIIYEEYFPSLTRKYELSFIGSIWNSVASLLKFLIVSFLSLPLYLIPGFQILLPWALNAYLAKKLFPYDVLQDFATKDEYVLFITFNSKEIWFLALLSGLLCFIPFLNILAAPITGLSFIFYSLGKLSENRNRIQKG